MKKRQIKLLIAVFICTLCLTALAPHVKASEVSSGEFPVTIDLEDSITYKNQKYEIELKAEHPDNPMPEGAKDGMFSIFITGEDTVRFPKINYSKIGIYKYTISQKIDNEEDYLDTKIYSLRVTVTRDEKTDTLEAASAMYVTGQENKVDGAVFYNGPPPIPVKPTQPPVEKPTQPPVKKPVETVKTGDENVIWPYLVMFVSGAGLLAIVTLDSMKAMKKKTDEDRR